MSDYIPMVGIRRSHANNNAEQKKEVKRQADMFDQITKRNKKEVKDEKNICSKL